MADHQIRASDQDREDAAFILAEAYAAGRLTRDELGQRLAAVYTARTWGRLRALTADLPAGPPCPAYRQRSSRCGRPGAGDPGTARLRLIPHLTGILIVATVIGLAGLAIPAGLWLAAVLIPAVLLLPPAIGINAALQHPRQHAMEVMPERRRQPPRPPGLPCRYRGRAGLRGTAPDRGCRARQVPGDTARWMN